MFLGMLYQGQLFQFYLNLLFYYIIEKFFQRHRVLCLEFDEAFEEVQFSLAD